MTKVLNKQQLQEEKLTCSCNVRRNADLVRDDRLRLIERVTSEMSSSGPNVKLETSVALLNRLDVQMQICLLC
jgi:hypothetical protein